ncbi:MAG: tripartite tricarboxylate transporter substrate binding protein [Betaproteobacteria bacterium]|nr:tripartite tricarboxylate transporter substrate binding protein [Betaproteobacteria bacterium]
MQFITRLLLFAAAAVACGTASGQSYPSEPVRLIVGFPAGGPADLFGRVLAQAMSANLGQQVVVENKSGVGGVLGMDAVAKALPDGYMLGLNNQGSVAMAPFALSSMPYHPQKDLALVTTVVKVPEVIVAHPSLPVNSFAELIAYAKANPGKVNYGSAGAGGITHLAGELLKAEARIDLVHVPYKGAAPAVSDLLGGQVQMGIFDIPVVLPHIRSGKLKAIAVTSAKRTPALPEVPTTAEVNYPNVISDNWYGLVAPAATPPDVLRRIHAAAVAALRSSALLEQFAKVSGIAFPSTPEEYAAFLTEEQARWSVIIKTIGFKE